MWFHLHSLVQNHLLIPSPSPPQMTLILSPEEEGMAISLPLQLLLTFVRAYTMPCYSQGLSF